MKKHKMDLGVFCYPGGVQYSNRARMVCGDYESIAFVSPSGRVRWDIPREKVDPVIVARIDLDAAETEHRFFADLGELRKVSPVRLLDRLLDMSPAGLVVDALSVSGMDARIDFLVDALYKRGIL